MGSMLPSFQWLNLRHSVPLLLGPKLSLTFPLSIIRRSQSVASTCSKVFNPKKDDEGGTVNLTSLNGFSKNVPSKERSKPCFFVTFKIIIRHVFPEYVIEIPQVVQEI